MSRCLYMSHVKCKRGKREQIDQRGSKLCRISQTLTSSKRKILKTQLQRTWPSQIEWSSGFWEYEPDLINIHMSHVSLLHIWVMCLFCIWVMPLAYLENRNLNWWIDAPLSRSLLQVLPPAFSCLYESCLSLLHSLYSRFCHPHTHKTVSGTLLCKDL